jgi:hypothetical protein
VAVEEELLQVYSNNLRKDVPLPLQNMIDLM